MNAEQIWDRAIDAVRRIGALAQLNDMVNDARQAVRRECGNCDHWMKRPACPREHGTTKGGPSMSAPACPKFSLETRATNLQAARMEKARAFAARNGLPIP